MRKSYSHYTADDVKALGLTVSRANSPLFEAQPLEPSELLLAILEINRQLPVESEKAKSELLITPVLNELRMRNPTAFTYFSGYQFNVDAKKGLKGFCDFIISKKHDAVFIESPLVAIVEAKHNQDLLDAAPQCIAEMYAAQWFNQQNNEPVTRIYGAVTNGYEWVFLQLENSQVLLDGDRYVIQDLPKLLGVWQAIIHSF